MKLSDIPGTGFVVLGLAGLAAGACVGFAAGTVAARDPERARRILRGVVREASRGIDQASRFAAEVGEQFGDLVAEAREEARSPSAEAPGAPEAGRKRRGAGERGASPRGTRRRKPPVDVDVDDVVDEPVGAK